MFKNVIQTLLVMLIGALWSQPQVVISPKSIDSVLHNPGIGVETFHQGTQPKSYPPSQIYYWRFHWSDIETKRGQIDFAKIDAKLKKARDNGQRVGIRIMSVNDYGCQTCIPQYVVDDAGGVTVSAGTDGGSFKTVFWPNYNKAFMDDVEALMKALGKRYDGHPDLNHIDLGFFGCWGEYNSACTKDKVPMWTQEMRDRNVNIHLATFPNTPIIGLAKEVYGLSKGTGWRGDCFGDWGFFGTNWNHMENSYPTSAKNCDDCWKKGMVSFEICWNFEKQHEKGFDLAKTMAKGLEWHMSSMNVKSSPIPDAYQKDLYEALKKMGYRLEITRLQHPKVVASGASFPIEMNWENKGVAPPYHTYLLRMELTPVNGGQTIKHDFNVDVRKWLPGSIKLKENIPLPKNLSQGDYNMRFALLFKDTKKPAIQLAIEGKDSEGWYPLSRIRVGEPSAIYRQEYSLNNPLTMYSIKVTPNVNITLQLPTAANVEVGLYSLQGKKLLSLWSGHQKAGKHQAKWESIKALHSDNISGVFFIKGTVDGVVLPTSMMINLE